MSRGTAAIALLAGLLACEAAPPAFSVESGTPRGEHSGPSLVVGSARTPPPGEYRFARVHQDGSVEARELFTVNGPGPWLAYEGTVTLPAAIAQHALGEADIARQTAAADDDGRPCLLSFTAASGRSWQGCAAPDLAVRVLSSVPRLVAPDVSPCGEQICQVRLLREIPAQRHERYGVIQQDIVLDAGGAFWCAASPRPLQEQLVTLTVEQGRISAAPGNRLFDWIVGNVAAASGPDSASDEGIRVQVRGSEASWRTVRRGAGDSIVSRWKRVAARFPGSCRPSGW